MKTTRKNSFKRTLALLLTICSLLAVMVPAVSAEEISEALNSKVLNAEDAEILTGSTAGDFDFGKSNMGAIAEVNGHDMLFLPHDKTFFVYDLVAFMSCSLKS